MNKYTFIITEKPDAALRIATALDESENPQKMYENGVPYYVARRERKIVVVPALGHLFTIADQQKRKDYPAFSFKWVPRYVTDRKAMRTRNWLQTISKLSKDADRFIDACDYDVEGCIIGYCILKYACGDREQTSKRMKYSTLTRSELQRAYAEPLPHLDFNLIEAGLTRHEVDWLYGINLSRALTRAMKNWSGKYATLSTGRVQGPTLRFLVRREEAIRAFVPTPFWQIRASVEIDGQVIEAKYEKERVETKEKAQAVVSACKGQKGKVEAINVRNYLQPPPFPFDLGALQNEAYNHFGYAPKQTLNLAQQLYLDALISYPRTDSQKLPPTICYETILRGLSKAIEYRNLASELFAHKPLRPREGEKDDPAHPAIYPTGNIPQRTLRAEERRIWDLVVRRFMAVFGGPAKRQDLKVSITVCGHCFHLSGRRMLTEGWTHYYDPYCRFEETVLPPVKKGQVVKIHRIALDRGFTEPPPRYNPSSLLREMEEEGIGTKATRADIIQTLYDRGYVRNERMSVTDLGFEVSGVLEKHCPTVVSTALTRELEEKMSRIQEEKEKREQVLADVVGFLKPVLERLKQQEKYVGEQLSNAVEKAKLEERTLGICRVCKTGRLIVTYSRKTGKRFVGCTNYFRGLCKASYPLPQKGTLRSVGRKCSKCGWPAVEVRMKSGRWILCLNPDCPSKKGSARS